MGSKTVLIVSGGAKVSEKTLERCAKSADFIIAADSGLSQLHEAKIKPDLIVGDFDSLLLDGWQGYYQDVPTKGFVPEKDYTDTELALEEAILLQPKAITILSATGTRQDHSLANMMLLSRAYRFGIEAVILDDFNAIRWLEPCSFSLERGPWRYMSLIPVSAEIEVSLTDFKYPLDHRIANRGDTLTVSNEWLEDKQRGLITLHRGEALLIQSTD